MINDLPYKTKKIFFLLIKWSIVISAFYFIYNELGNNHHLKLSDFARITAKNAVFTIKNSSILLLLSTLNWFFEIKKWQILVGYIKPIGFLTALKHTLSALTASIFSPNRIIDYVAKLVQFEKKFRKKILLLNVINNFSQMLATIIFGSIGSFIFFKTYNSSLTIFKTSHFLILIITPIIGIVFLSILQNKYKFKKTTLSKIKKQLALIPKDIKSTVFIFSIIRYLLFSFQFYFLLTIFNIHLSYYETMVGISTMYLLASILPIISIFDVLIKGSLAIYIFKSFFVNELITASVIFTMWILNTVIPIVIGSYYVITFNFNVVKKA